MLRNFKSLTLIISFLKFKMRVSTNRKIEYDRKRAVYNNLFHTKNSKKTKLNLNKIP